MDATQIIIKPLVTEKSHWESESRNRVTFEVHPDASKTQIRDAVQKLYKVKVVGVATQQRSGKYKRTRFGPAKSRDWKRAIVQLDANSKIELF